MIDAFDFINNKLGGFNKMQNYNKSLLTLGCDILISEWNTSLLVPASMTAFMSNVILPVQNHEHCSILQKRLFDENKISMIYGHVLSPDDTKIYYTRISAQCYLSLNDFILLASNVKRISLELQS